MKQRKGIQRFLSCAFLCICVVFGTTVPSFADTYNVTYNCGTGGGTAPVGEIATTDAIFTPAANTCTSPNPEYVFMGWLVSGTNDIKPAEQGFVWDYLESKTLTAQWDYPFVVTTTELGPNSTFQFKISASGTFTVDCGTDGTLSGNGVVAGTTTINRSSIVSNDTYTCTYSSTSNTEQKTIIFAGTASAYNTGIYTAAISFSGNTSVAVARGNLSTIFPYLGSSNGQYPKFAQIFFNCTNLTSVQGPLFGGYSVGVNRMFFNAFSGCTNLTSLPENLFASFSSGAEALFSQAFVDCTSLESIPANLFKFATPMPGAQSMFFSTFKNCTSLTYIPENLFARVSSGGVSMFDTTFFNTGLAPTVAHPNPIPDDLFANITTGASAMFQNTFADCSGLTTIPPHLFANITTAATSMFQNTFLNCSGLTSFVPPTLFAGIIPRQDSYPSNMMSYVFKNSGLATECPADYYQFITGYEQYWNDKVSCKPCPAGTHSPAGSTLETQCVQSFSVTYSCGSTATGFNGGTGTPPVDNTQYASGASVTVPTAQDVMSSGACVAPSSYPAFGNWVCNSGSGNFNVDSGGTFNITANTVCTVRWGYISGHITLSAPGIGTSWYGHSLRRRPGLAVYLDNGQTQPMSTDQNPLPSTDIPSWSGHVFAGYYSEAQGNATQPVGTQYIDADGYITDDGLYDGIWGYYDNGVLSPEWYAGWTLGTYNINYYNVDGATWASNTDHPSTYTYGTGASIGVPSKTNYVFTGWCVGADNCPDYANNASGYTISSNNTGDVSLYAQWDCDTGYSLVNGECVQDACPITLLPNNGTSVINGGNNSNTSKTIYSQYGVGAFKENVSGVLNGQMTSSNGLQQTPPATPLGIPVGITLTISFNLNLPSDPQTGVPYTISNQDDYNSYTKQREFAGYYQPNVLNGVNSPAHVNNTLQQNSALQYIDADGYITTNGDNVAKGIVKENGVCPDTTWYAQYDCPALDPLPSVPTVPGYTSSQWKGNSSSGGFSLGINATPVLCNDCTIKLTWTPNTYTITYAPGEIGGNNENRSVKFDANTYADGTTPLNAISNPFSAVGYVFDKWSSNHNVGTGAGTQTYYDEGDSFGYYKVVGNTIITALWNCDEENGYYRNQDTGQCELAYSLTYGCGIAVGDSWQDANGPYTANTSVATLSSATGCTTPANASLTGWDCGGETIVTPGDNITITGATTCTAQWTPTTVLINYVCPVAGTASGFNQQSNAPYELFNYAVGCNNSGHDFLGWKCDHNLATGEGTSALSGGSYDYDYPLQNGVIVNGTGIFLATEDVWCEPQWTKRVWYSCGDGTGNGPTDSNQYLQGDTATVLDNAVGNCTAPSGYIFNKWSCNNGIGDKVANNTFVLPDNDVTCTAKYKFNTIFLEWDPDGGTPDPIETPESCFYGEINGITGIAHPTKTGYTFNGWNVTGWQCYVPAFNTSISGSARGFLDEVGVGSWYEQFGLTEPCSWAVRFSYGQVFGTSKCGSSSTGGPGDEYGNYCWCRLNGFTPKDGEYCATDAFPWVYLDSFDHCDYNCASFCSLAVKDNSWGRRSQILTKTH